MSFKKFFSKGIKRDNLKKLLIERKTEMQRWCELFIKYGYILESLVTDPTERYQIGEISKFCKEYTYSEEFRIYAKQHNVLVAFLKLDELALDHPSEVRAKGIISELFGNVKTIMNGYQQEQWEQQERRRIENEREAVEVTDIPEPEVDEIEIEIIDRKLSH